MSKRNVQESNLPSKRGPIESNRSHVSGAYIGDYVINPVFQGAMMHQTSAFDNELESSFEGAGETLAFETDRL